MGLLKSFRVGVTGRRRGSDGASQRDAAPASPTEAPIPEDPDELDAAEALKVQRRRDWDMGMEILREADVICAQMISAGGDFLRGLGAFNAILIDEVAQDWMHACMQASKQACIHTDT